MYVYLSFCDEVKHKSLGVCIVEVDDQMQAIQEAWDQGVNPGGEVLAFTLTAGQFKAQELEVNRLYSREELVEMGFETLKNFKDAAQGRDSAGGG
jgi:hypothetical protein